jgi:hypothetical protein
MMPMQSSPPVRLNDLTFGSCRWPVAPSAGPTEFFCGEPAVLGCSWCETHRRRAFLPTRAKRTGSDRAPVPA